MAEIGEIILTFEVEQAIAKVVGFALNNNDMQRQESVLGQSANPYLDRRRSREVPSGEEVEEKKGLQISTSISK